jgi:hypothetical protein
MLVNKVLVIIDRVKGRRIIPQLAFDGSSDFASLVYDHQRLACVEQDREMVQK